MTDDDDEVGYKKPPRKHRFKKGQSGNPTGRRARSKGFDALLDQQLDEKVVVSLGTRKVRVPKRQALIMKLMNDALSGKTRAQELVFRHMHESAKPDPFADKPYDAEIWAELAASLASPEDEPEEE